MNLMYFAIIPILLLLITMGIIELLEKTYHKYFLKKHKFYLISIITTLIIVIAIVVVSLVI